ncbi:serine protease [Actinoplanes sp. M2I2]|uniref:trypsin-like serine peptidase n=1 Tax=Actinoplanes sp. M2I2 TaxID=1734444 RepID=UPI0020214468|nr:serine protease [Actinoplanes sp. M2I2]
MSELIVEAGESRLRLRDGQVGYIQTVAGGLALSGDPRGPGRAGFIVRLIGGWYLYTDDPATTGLEIDGARVCVQATPLTGRHVRMASSPRSHRARDDRMTLAQALRESCPTYGDLEQMLAARCSVELRDLGGPRAMDKVAARVVAYAEQFCWLPELAQAVGWNRPEVPDDERPDPAPVLDESIVDLAAGFQDPDDFGRKLQENSRRICRIEVDAPRRKVHGTGFLVGPDLVLTNYHVLADVLTGQSPPSAVRFRFGYRVVGDHVDRGREAGLARRWNVASSPPDRQQHRRTGGERLDYALVRLNAPVGRDRDDSASGGVRGWLRLSPGTGIRPARSQLLILQHPNGGPLKMAMAPDGLVDVRGNRLIHRVNTLGGSSGAPCLDFDFTLLGLHRSGCDDRRNEAVPIEVIARHLRAQGHDRLLNT